MNTPTRSVFGTAAISPRSLGYSYLPGNAITTIHAPVPIRTFGTAASPNPGASPITPQRVGALTIPGAAKGTSILSGLFS